jgi:8-oxo-dGTP pyrophosphatase MutT (NUDIX family)
VKLRDPVSTVEFWVPPGGKIEEGESPVQAAVRETLEETGIRVIPTEDPEHVLVCPFRWAGEDYLSTTHYITVRLAEAETALTTQDSKTAERESYILEHNWISIEDALQEFSRPQPLISNAVREVISKISR